jgi:hypothetical protein
MADADPQIHPAPKQSPSLKQSMTSRMVVMMTPLEKQAIETRAHALHLTPSEMVRRAAQNYQPVSNEDSLEMLAAELGAAVKSMRTDMKSALQTLDDHRAEMARLKKTRAAA